MPPLRKTHPATGADAHRSERRLRKRENTRAALVEAAARVIAAKGFEGARIDDVVREARFTRGAFYSNYDSLDEVLTEALIVRARALLAQVTSAVDALEGEVTVDSLMTLLDSIREDARTIYLISTEYTLHRMRHPEAAQVPLASREEFTAALSGIVEGILARMDRRPLIPAEAISDVVAVFFLDSIAKEAAGGGRITGPGPRDYLRYVVEAVIMGLSAPLELAGGGAPNSGPAAPSCLPAGSGTDGASRPCGPLAFPVGSLEALVARVPGAHEAQPADPTMGS